MPITRVTRPRQTRVFSTYDLEWSRGSESLYGAKVVKQPQVTLVGVYDGKAYTAYRTVDAFLNEQLTKRNHGRWFYAHAGGLADMLFVLQRLSQRPEYEIQASFSGSSAIIVSVRRGRNRWVFCDSLWLFGTALANVAKWVGMEKGTVDFETENFRELAEYNRLDCLILWRAIDAFETALLDIGGELMMTLASCAMRLFRRRFLKRDIKTNAEVNLAARSAYFGSRVEVFERNVTDGYYYDINSSFPFAMTSPAPGNLKGVTRSVSDREDALYLAETEVVVPDDYFPPLPYRHEGSVFFPTGQWKGWFNQVDLRLLEERGGKVLKVGRVLHFEPFDDLAEYATTLYEKRRTGTTDFDKVVYKLLLNSLYGKFAENPHKQQMLINPPFTTCPHNPPHPPKLEDPRESACMTQLLPGIWLLENEVDIPHECVPISAQITALARKNLYQHMRKCDTFHYCDTDGFSTNRPDLPTGEMLGELKLELVFKEAEFVSPKVYRIGAGHELKDGKLKPFPGKVKAKGMSLADKRDLPSHLTEEERAKWAEGDGYLPKGTASLDKSTPLTEDERKKWIGEVSLKRWMQLREGQMVDAERMARIKELYRSGNTVPITQTIKKMLRGYSRPKRRTDAYGSTTPWDIKDLKEPWKKPGRRRVYE